MARGINGINKYHMSQVSGNGEYNSGKHITFPSKVINNYFKGPHFKFSGRHLIKIPYKFYSDDLVWPLFYISYKQYKLFE